MQTQTIINSLVNPTIENLHETMRRQFQQMYIAPKQSFKELQARERQEAVARIKNVLFANLLIKIIKTNAESGHETPAEIDLQSLLEVI